MFHFKKKLLLCFFLFMTQLSIAQKVDDKLYNRGTTYLNAGDYEKAVKNFNKSIEKNDKFIDAYFNRALSYTYLKKYDEAINDYSIVIQLDPNNEVSFFNRSRIFNLKKEYQKAISDLNSAIKIDKKFIEVYFDKAQLMIKMRNLDGAIYTYTNLIEILPNDPIPYYNRGLIKYRNGDKKGACEDAALSKSKNGFYTDIDIILKELIEYSCDEKQKKILLADDKDMDVPFATVEKVPLYPGCEKVPKSEKRKCFQEQIQKHIARNFRYPEEAQYDGIQGRVFVQFTIGKNGSIIGIKTRGPHPLLEDEARRIISLLPRVSPGESGGEKVNVPFSIPIIFKLQ